MDIWPYVVGGVVGVSIAIGVIRLCAAKHLKDQATGRTAAIAEFLRLRSELAEPFRVAAAATGKPRGLRWVACELDDRTRFAADRRTGALYAMNGVTIRFEAIPGGDMEDVEAVGNLRSATAVFLYREGRWTSDGRVVFNLDPDQAVEHFRETVEAVDVAPATRQRDAAR